MEIQQFELPAGDGDLGDVSNDAVADLAQQVAVTDIAARVRSIVGPDREIGVWVIFGHRSGVRNGESFFENERRIDITVDELTYERRTGATVEEMLMAIQRSIAMEQQIQETADALATMLEDLDYESASEVLSRVRRVTWGVRGRMERP